MELVNGDHNITDEITTVDTPGHTPGHMSLLVSAGTLHQVGEDDRADDEQG